MAELSLELKYQRWLMASYMYYKLDYSLMLDEEYDSVAKELLENWDSFEHQHKHLITREDLEAGTGYAISYPSIIKGASLKYLRDRRLIR